LTSVKPNTMMSASVLASRGVTPGSLGSGLVGCAIAGCSRWS